MNKDIFYIDRTTQEIKKEKVYYEKTLFFLYHNAFGRFLNSLICKNVWISKLFGWWQQRKITKSKIIPFIQKYAIDAAEFEKEPSSFSSFNSFFIRKLKKEARPLAKGAILPADGRYLAYQNVETCNGFVVKGKKFSLQKLLDNADLAEKYAQGSMIIVRLCPSDYHRFHFPFDCVPGETKLINGPLFSVNPISIKQNIELLTENKRTVTELSSTYGKALFIEVGATCVGAIHQTYAPYHNYKKGDEKGYFSFGGSSIILLFEPNRIQLAEDLLTNSAKQMETLCQFGQSLETLN